MAQFIFFFLFITALLVGAYTYMAPTQEAITQMKSLIENSGFNPEENITRVKTQQVNMTTREGQVQIRRLIDDASEEQKEFIKRISEEQQVLKNVEKEISNIKKQANGKNNIDLLRLNSLEAELQDDQRLLVDQGRALIALNNQLTKNRQWLSDQNDLVDINTQSSLNTLQQHDASANGQANMFFNNVKQQNNDVFQHVQDLIDEERQKAQDIRNR